MGFARHIVFDCIAFFLVLYRIIFFFSVVGIMAETNIDSILGRLVVEKDLCSSEEVHECISLIRLRAKSDEPVSLTEALIGRNYVTKTQIERLNVAIAEARPTHRIPGYQMLEKLGAGAMAVVFKARQLSLDRSVAIKVLPPRLTENPEYVKRFYQEGRAAAKLNHNNIVQAFDVAESNGVHYFVMEYVKGKTVYDDLSKGKVFSESDALSIAIQIASALEHAHQRGLIHRDVKPKNIMITEDGVAKLADMGLAREATDEAAAQSEAGRAYGTPYYISPEQIRGEIDIDFRADIYSLGATFYHMVTGRVPFEASTPSAVMHKHLKEPLVPPDHINTTLSVGVAEVIEMMMAKRRKDRYPSAKLLLEDLQAVRAGESPLQAHQKFDTSELAKMEQAGAMTVDEDVPDVPGVSSILALKTAIIMLAAALIVAVLMIVVLASRGGEAGS